MTPEALFIALFGILYVEGASDIQGYRRLTEARLEGAEKVHHDEIDSSVMCCALCEEQDTCIAVNHNKEFGFCELIQTSDIKPRPTVDSPWSIYFMNTQDIDYKSDASTHLSTVYEGYWMASYAVDGLYILNPEANGLCASTEGAVYTNWLMVDFTRNYPIKDMLIWNRDNYTYDRLRNLVITVSPTMDSIDAADNVCTTYTGPPASAGDNPILLTCSRIMEGRFLKIRMDTPYLNYLTICEIDLM